jgi:hypothetical protein
LFVGYIKTLSASGLHGVEWLMNESQIEWDLEGNSRGLMEVLSGYLPGGTEENYLSQDWRYPGRDLNWALSGQKYRALRLHEPVRFDNLLQGTYQRKTHIFV